MNTEPVMAAAADVIRTFGHGGTPCTRCAASRSTSPRAS
jgi:hypothetical protein